MKYFLLTSVLTAAFATTSLADDAAMETAFRDALYAEEVKGDATAALESYTKLLEQLEARRDLHATALFRQAECFRKLGKKDEAIAGFQKVLRLYPDVERFQKQAGESLAALGVKVEGAAVDALSEEDRYRAEQMAKVEQILKESPDRLNTGNPSMLANEVSGGDIKMVEFLLGKGAKPNVHGADEQPLTIAARLGHKAICEMQIKHGADVQIDNNAPLAAALKANNLEILKLLLVKGANVDSSPLLPGPHPDPFGQDQDFTGRSLLGFAVNCSNDAFQILLDAKPQLNTFLLPTNKSPLALAFDALQPAKFKMLLAAGADPNFPADQQYKTPLLIDAFREARSTDHGKERDAMIQLLIDKGADWKVKNTFGDTVLHALTQTNRIDWLKKAVAAGVDVNSQNNKGDTPLMYAAAEAVPVLLELGADPNFVDNEGNTAVHLLQHSIDLLLKGNANGKVPDLSVKNKAGLTALDALLVSTNPSPSKLLALAHAHAPTTRFRVRDSEASMWDQSPLAKLAKSPEGRETFRLLCEDYLASRQGERPTGIWFSMGVATGNCGQHLAFVKLHEKPDFASTRPTTTGANPPAADISVPRLSDVVSNFLNSGQGTTAVTRIDFSRLIINRQDSDGKLSAVEVDPLTMKTDFPLEWGDIICVGEGEPISSQEFFQHAAIFQTNRSHLHEKADEREKKQ